MPEFSISNIINHCFHFDNGKGDLGIGCDMIIGQDLMVQIGPTANFKSQILQWDGYNVHMTEPSKLLGKSYITKR